MMRAHKGTCHGNVAGRVRVQAAMLSAHSDFSVAQQEAQLGWQVALVAERVGHSSCLILTPPLIMPFITPVRALHI